MGALDGKVAIVTGAGHGLGRCHAELFAREGAAGIVVNDLGVGLLGSTRSRTSVDETAELVREAGGDAIPYFGDCANWNAGKEMVELALQRWGRLDILINNAGVLRDGMIFNLSETDWDDVIHVHLKGTFCTTRHACQYWRSMAKTGEHVAGRVINTTSTAGLWGSAGQANYACAKAGVVGFTLSVAFAMKRYGVTSNVVSPVAETNPDVVIDGGSRELLSVVRPEDVSPLYAFLASDRAAHVTARVFLIAGGQISRVDGFRLVDGPLKRHGAWSVDEIGDIFDDQIGGENPESAPAIRRHLQSRLYQS